jgi:1-aminocyclopropane-1-carboxylate deaminase/D-cysteine desulfhydrase-like pyridoxal-dependent ACC family enzyme
MLSIAALCHDKKWEFEYYTKTISSQAKEQQCQSNYSKAIELGMTCIEIEHTKYHERIEALHLNFDASMLTLAQGGANINAEEGIKVLATEIKEWQYFNSIENLKVVTPSGTGTTAYFLAKNLECEVYTIACVGNEMYLKEQISSLGEYPSNLTFLTTQKRYHFAKLYKEFYEIYHDIKKAGEGIDLEIDLLYAPKMFLALKENGIKGDILYIHSGGLIGNESMVQRYEHKKKLARH